MTAPGGFDFGISVGVDATQSKQGADLHTRSVEQIKAANAGLAQSTRVTAEQAKQIEQQWIKLGAQGENLAKIMARYQVVEQATAAAQSQTLAATQKAAPGLARLANSYEALAAQALGANPTLLKTGTILGGLGASSALTIGVMGGLALLAKGYDLLTEKSRRARQEVESLIDKLKEQAQLEGRGPLFEQVKTTAERDRLVAQLQRIREQEIAVRTGPLALTPEGYAEQLRLQREAVKVTRELADAETARLQAQRAVAGANKTSREQEIQDVVQLLNLGKQTAADEARRLQLLRENEATLRKGNLSLAERAKLESELHTLRTAGVKLTQEQARAHEEEAQAFAKGQQFQIDARQSALDLLIRFRRMQDDLTEDFRKLGGSTVEWTRKIKTEWAAFEQDRFKKNAAIEIGLLGPDPDEMRIRFQAVTRAMAADLQIALSRGLQDFFTAGIRDWQSFFSVVGRMGQEFATRLQKYIDDAEAAGQSAGLARVGRVAGRVAAGIGAGVPIGSSSGSAGLGLLGGAVTGFQVAGPLGALGGAIGGFVSGLLASGAAAREHAEALRQAKQEWARALDEFRQITNPRGGYAQSLVDYTTRYQDTRNQAFKAFGFGSKADADYLAQKYADRPLTGGVYDGLIKDARAYRDALAALDKEFAEGQEILKARIENQKYATLQELEVRRLRGTGQQDAADQLALEIQQKKERDDITNLLLGSDSALNQILLDQLDVVQQLERDTLKAAQAEEELRKTRQRTDIASDFAVRALRASGDDRGAGVLQATIEFGLGVRQLDDWLKDGLITVEQYATYQDVLNQEMRKSIDQIHEEAEARDRARTRQQGDIAGDFAVRALRGRGDPYALDQADILAAEEQYRKGVEQLDDWLREGLITTEQYATYQAVLNDELDRARTSVSHVTDALKAMQEALLAEQRATEDLTVRHLRATVGDEAAADAAAFYAAQRELATAIEEKRSAEYIAYLQQVLEEEAAYRDRVRRERQQAAFDQAFPTTGAAAIAASATSVNLAVGVSETTAGRMTGLLAAQLVHQASLPRIEATLGRIERLLGQGRSLDEVLAGLDADANRNAGNQPGNR